MSEQLKKTALEWYKDCKDIEILDPDGFDRSNYEYTWNELLMTEEEFNDRLARCTCTFARGYFLRDDGESEGTKLAAELRAASNNLTEEERNGLNKKALKIINGDETLL